MIAPCYLRRHGLTLRCRSVGHDFSGGPLSRANRVQDFNPSDRTPSRPRRSDASHRPHRTCHCPMVATEPKSPYCSVAEKQASEHSGLSQGLLIPA
jgi:hypothetical protein